MRLTIGDTAASEVRWRIAMQLALWGVKLAPDGNARDALIDALQNWVDSWRKRK